MSSKGSPQAAGSTETVSSHSSGSHTSHVSDIEPEQVKAFLPKAVLGSL